MGEGGTSYGEACSGMLHDLICHMIRRHATPPPLCPAVGRVGPP